MTNIFKRIVLSVFYQMLTFDSIKISNQYNNQVIIF